MQSFRPLVISVLKSIGPQIGGLPGVVVSKIGEEWSGHLKLTKKGLASRELQPLLFSLPSHFKTLVFRYHPVTIFLPLVIKPLLEKYYSQARTLSIEGGAGGGDDLVKELRQACAGDVVLVMYILEHIVSGDWLPPSTSDDGCLTSGLVVKLLQSFEGSKSGSKVASDKSNMVREVCQSIARYTEDKQVDTAALTPSALKAQSSLVNLFRLVASSSGLSGGGGSDKMVARGLRLGVGKDAPAPRPQTATCNSTGLQGGDAITESELLSLIASVRGVVDGTGLTSCGRKKRKVEQEAAVKQTAVQARQQAKANVQKPVARQPVASQPKVVSAQQPQQTSIQSSDPTSYSVINASPQILRKTAMKILKKQAMLDTHSIFLNTVTDAVAPGYSKVVSRGVSISSIKARIEAIPDQINPTVQMAKCGLDPATLPVGGPFLSLQHFDYDVATMYDNCILFNKGK